MTWRADIITLFPELFPGALAVSLSGKALEKGLWSCVTHDLRQFGLGRHKAIDDTPYGGGAGMVMRPDVIAAAIDTVDLAGRPVIYPTPRGRRLEQADVRRYAQGAGVVILCGRFEGVDERVLKARQVEQVSMGDYILSGGEIPASALLDACVRLIPGVMGSSDSASEESFEDGLLEYPHYTKPAEWEGMAVPPVLLSGHHGDIADWRLAQSREITETKRPDLWAHHIARESGI